MSQCGELGIGVLAAPLLLVVLLVAGIGYLALQGARLVGQLAIQGIQFAGTALAAGVRAATHAITAAGTFVAEAAAQGAQWASSLFESAQVRERLQATAHRAYQAAASALSSAVETAGSTIPGSVLAVRSTPGVAPTAQPIAGSSSMAVAPVRHAAAMPGHSAVLQTGAAVESLSAIPMQGAPYAGTPSRTTVSAPSTVQPGHSLAASTEHRLAVEALARAQAVSTALSAEVPLRLVADRWYASQISNAEAALSAAHVSLRTGDTRRAVELAGQAESLLTTTVHESHQYLVKAERATVAATVGNTLQDMGYDVRMASASDNVALVGRREHHTLAMVVRPGGRLEVDMAGFEGGACNPEARALLEGLRRNGLVISEQNLKWHGRFEGGALIRKAQRQGKTLEVALAEMMMAPETSDEARATEAAPVRRRSRLTPRSEEERQRQARAWMWEQGQTQKGCR